MELHNADGIPCGCWKMVKGPVASTLCTHVHGPTPDQGALQMVTALRGEGYKGRLYVELCGFSHAAAGNHQGRALKGKLRAGPDKRHDLVLERYRNAINEEVLAGTQTSDVVGIELDGSEHEWRPITQKRDKKKAAKAKGPFDVIRVKFPCDDVPATGDVFWQEEAEKILSAWG